MKKTLFSLSLLCMLFISKNGFSQVNHVVISQVYGGGGNAGAPYKNDFVELFNPTASPISLTGWSVQYFSAAGSTASVTNLSGNIQPGAYYLVQQASGGAVGITLPTADATGTVNMSGTAGKVFLVNAITALTTTCSASATIIDKVGFGATANCFEGTGPTPAPSNTTSVSRASNGCTDTDQNATDFTAGAVSPRNSASPINCCLTAPTVTATAITTTVNASYSYSITATLASTYSISAGSLPTGLNLNAITGVISGTTTSAALGSSMADITVTNCAGSAVATFSFTTTNNTVSFTGGANQTFTVCQNTAATSINSLLQISDADINQTETWSVTAAPSNGTIVNGGTQLSNGSTLNPTGFTYMPNATFNGTDIFSVQVDDGSGSPAVTTITVTINPSPTVSATSATVCAGTTTTLTASGTATSYTWSTNETTTSISPTVTTTTVYTVTGTGANNCVNTATTSIWVNSLPTISANSSSICVGETTTLTATGTATSYTWSTGDNTVSISPTVTTTTNYNVSGTDANNCLNTATATITVNSLPLINVNSPAICIGETATLTATGTATTYTWSTGDNTVSISPTTTTTTDYTVTASDANCTNMAVATITVNSLPVSSFSATTVCLGTSTTFSNNSTSASTYTWSFGDGSISTLQSPIIEYPVCGTYVVALTVTNIFNCTAVSTNSVTVNCLPTVSVNSTTVCAGTTTTLTATGTATSYTWNTGDNTTSISPTLTTTTNYTVVGQDANGCSNISSTTVTVNPLIVTSATVTNVTCNGSCDGSATVTATGGVGSFTYSWIPGGMTTSSVNNLCATGAAYNVLVTDANSCSQVQQVFIASPTAITAFITPATTNTLCAGDSIKVKAIVIGGTSPYTYLWNSVSGLNNSSTDSIVAKPTTTSTYTLNVTDSHGCTYTDLIQFNVSNCGVGITQVSNNNNISIYPNPATDAFYLQTNTAFDNAVVEVYDMMGRKVLTEKVQGNLTTINLNNLNNAIYQVRVLNNGTLIYQSKLVKQQ
ncbi:MAG: PKD domain-containing protein [Bacteroidia bacterium]